MLPSRASNRLDGFDYAAPGAYFVTICCHARRFLFGNIRNGQCHRPTLGHLAADHLAKVPSYYGNLLLDEWIVMPNHLHAILLINGIAIDPDKRPAAGLPSIVSCYKAGVTREAKQLGLAPGLIWQPRYHDHVLRHEQALDRAREYIRDNPMQWTLDRDNPSHTELNPFYAWMEAYTKQASVGDATTLRTP